MMPADKLARVVGIINSGPSKLATNDDGELVLNMDGLDNVTFWRLLEVVGAGIWGGARGGRDRRRSQVSGHVFCFLAPCLRLCLPLTRAHPSPSPGHEKKNKQIEAARPARSGVVPALASSAAYLSVRADQMKPSSAALTTGRLCRA